MEGGAVSVEMEEAVRDTLSYAFFCTDDYVADALREVAKADDWRADRKSVV